MGSDEPEKFQSGSELFSGSAGESVQGERIQPEQPPILDDEEHSEPSSSESGSENLEVGSSVSGKHKLKKKEATVSESGEDWVWVRSMIQARVRLESKTTAETYIFPQSGSEVKVDPRDVAWLLGKRVTGKRCCGPQGNNLAFELVE